MRAIFIENCSTLSQEILKKLNDESITKLSF